MVTPRYASIFIQRFCPRNCKYCKAKYVRGIRLLRPEEWIEAFDILWGEGVSFFLILGNEVLCYPWIVELVKMLRENGFYGKYAMYSTFPEPWYSDLREKLVDAGLYNISCGVDVVEGADFDRDIAEKSLRGLRELLWFKERGVPDLQATVTIHRYNYKLLPKIFDTITKCGIWIGSSIIEYSEDGSHDFFGTREEVGDFLIPESEYGEFEKMLKYVAGEIRRGRWMVQPPPEYFEFLAESKGRAVWHCSLPLIIHIEEDGSLRSCTYRRGVRTHRYTVFDIGKKISMEDYANLQRLDCSECPGCGAWSYWWMAEFYYRRGEMELNDKVFQQHYSVYWVR